uniref:Uncharacterized protein n=1 Tax=Gouania willdenowi TaxID=441366 RepID=A0A8C5GQI2_GOUWI
MQNLCQQKNLTRYSHYCLNRIITSIIVCATAATAQMAIQNRMALDTILASTGGVCAMVGATCCTYIPNNSSESIEDLSGFRPTSRWSSLLFWSYDGTG